MLCINVELPLEQPMMRAGVKTKRKGRHPPPPGPAADRKVGSLVVIVLTPFFVEWGWLWYSCIDSFLLFVVKLEILDILSKVVFILFACLCP